MAEKSAPPPGGAFLCPRTDGDRKRVADACAGRKGRRGAGRKKGKGGEWRHITRQSAQPTTMPKNEEKRATGIA